MPRIETIGNATLYLGDCREILPTVGTVDAVVADPPYGINYNPKRQRATPRRPGKIFNRPAEKVIGDAEQFDPRDILIAPSILWGATNYAHLLPLSNGWLFWDKQKAEGFVGGQGELAWTNILESPKRFIHMWDGFRRASEVNLHYHPTQKPVALMEWCLSFIPLAKTIFDPFMGSGTTGVAAINLGRKFIGIEIDPSYFDIACKRLDEAQRQGDMFLIAAAQ